MKGTLAASRQVNVNDELHAVDGVKVQNLMPEQVQAPLAPCPSHFLVLGRLSFVSRSASCPESKSESTALSLAPENSPFYRLAGHRAGEGRAADNRPPLRPHPVIPPGPTAPAIVSTPSRPRARRCDPTDQEAGRDRTRAPVPPPRGPVQGPGGSARNDFAVRDPGRAGRSPLEDCRAWAWPF